MPKIQHNVCNENCQLKHAKHQKFAPKEKMRKGDKRVNMAQRAAYGIQHLTHLLWQSDSSIVEFPEFVTPATNI